jgi:hypothetical protein
MMRSAEPPINPHGLDHPVSEDLPSHFIDRVHEALLRSFWRKTALPNFLRRHKISENFLTTQDSGS